MASSGDRNESVNPSILQRLQISQHEAASIMNSNSSEYNWLGNSFLNPPGVPTFTPRQIKAYFERRNVLFLGDSTSRRLSHTIFGIITADNLDDVKLAEIDGVRLMNGDKTTKTQCNENQRRNRSLPGVPNIEGLVCTDQIVVGASGNNNTQMIRNTVKKFDRGTVYCYCNFSYLWRDYEAENNKPAENDNTTIDKDSSKRSLNRHLQAIYKDYDLVIISVGVWELAIPKACEKNMSENSTAPLRMRKMLNNLERNSPNDLQIVLRTSGFDSRHADNSKLFDSNAVTRDFFRNITTRGDDHGESRANLTLVDYGSVISKRSFGDNEIKSLDGNGAHYGINARLLLVQQQMHELVKADLTVAKNV